MAVCLQVAVPRSRLPLKVQNLRVNNVEIPNSKKVEISLQYIYGIGSTTAKAILVNTVSLAAAITAAATAAAAE
jgi:small subunit ribosomal protein S13